MRLIKNIKNTDVAFKVDYMVSLGSLCHFYGCWVNINGRYPMLLDDEKLSIGLGEMDSWLEKVVEEQEDHRKVGWKRLG